MEIATNASNRLKYQHERFSWPKFAVQVEEQQEKPEILSKLDISIESNQKSALSKWITLKFQSTSIQWTRQNVE